MPPRTPISQEIREFYISLRRDRPELTQSGRGLELVRRFPDDFDAAIVPSSHDKRCWREIPRDELPDVPRVKPVPQSRLRYAHEAPELEFEHRDKLIVISDLHASAHDARYVERALAVIDAHEIGTVVYCGDQLDNAYLGHGGIRSRFAAPFEENVEQFARIANLISAAGAREAFVIQGNHDDKPLRGTDGETTYPGYWNAHIRPLLDSPDEYTVTHRYYCTMRPELEAPWPWPDGYRNLPWVFMHAKEYSKIPGRNPAFQADIQWCNVVNGHEHHLLATKHQSGKAWVCAAGTGQHLEGAEYKSNRPTKHPQWMPGFITLLHNYPLCWHMDMPDAMFEQLLRGGRDD